jgi:hypothetical protein
MIAHFNMNDNCQHIIEEGHMGGNCKLCGYSEIWEWYGMYEEKKQLNQINGEQHTEQIHYEKESNSTKKLTD